MNNAEQPEPDALKSVWRSGDSQFAKTTEELIELRRQAVRRKVTAGIVGTLCLGTLYLLVCVPEMRSEAFAGILGLGTAAATFYYARETS